MLFLLLLLLLLLIVLFLLLYSLVQAFGVPDRKVGEEICVYLRLKEGATLTEDEIREYCKDKVRK